MLRRLNGSLSPIFRGDGGFSPLQASGLHAWFKADAGTLNSSDAPASNGQTIKTWQDQSGNGRNATESVDGNRPLLVSSSSLNGMPALNYDGVAKRLMATISVTTTTVTAFFAIRMDTAAIARLSSIVASVNADNNDIQSAILAYFPSGTSIEGHRNGSKSTKTSGIPGAPYNAIICSQWDGTNHTLYFNSKTGQTPVASTGSFNAVEWWLGCGRAGPGTPQTFTDCHIAEAILYNTSLSSTDRDGNIDYLNGRYAVF